MSLQIPSTSLDDTDPRALQAIFPQRHAVAGGALLYDAALSSPAQMHWFDAAWWRQDATAVPGGRGQVHFLRAQDEKWVLRHYRRGGLIRHLSTDRYWWLGESRTRSFAEWRLLARLYALGLPVPRPVAAAYRRHGPFVYSAALITVCLPARHTLRDLYVADRVTAQTWHAVGSAIRQLHDAHVAHADLNAANVLIGDDGRVYFVDFDRGQHPRGGMQQANLDRLQRSLRKAAQQMGREGLDESSWNQLLDGYRRS